MSPRSSIVILSALLAGSVPVPTAAAETAEDWMAGCRPYVEMLREDGEADDVQITWCVAKSLGISQGLATGSRIGAISMASALVVVYELDQQAVFGMFEDRNAASLLQICMPRDTGARAKIEAVYDFLAARPEKLEQPMAAAFFEGLQARWPCDPP